MIKEEIESLKKKNKALYELNELLKIRLKAVEELSKIINSKTDIKLALNITLDLILDLFKVPSGSIMLLDRTGKYMEISVARGEKSDSIKNLKINLGEGIAGKVALTGETIIDNNVENNPNFNRDIGEKIEYIPKNILCVPIRVKNKILGVIEIFDKGGGSQEFTNDDTNLLLSIANTLGTILENVKLYNIANSAYKKLSGLIEISKTINTTIQLKKLLNYIMESAKDVLEAEGSSLMLIDESTGELYFNITAGEGSDKLKEIRIPMGKGIAGIVAQTGKPLLIDDAINDPRVYKAADATTKMVTRNILAVPMRVRNKTIGVLEVINAKNRDRFDKYDLEMFQAFADQAAIAIYNRDLIYNLQTTNNKLEHKIQEIKTLYKLSEDATLETDITKMFMNSLKIINEEFGINRLSIMLLDDDAEVLTVAAAIGIDNDVLKDIRVKVGEQVSGTVIKNKTAILVENMDIDKRFGRNKRLRYKSKSFVSVPIKFRNKIVGVLNATEKHNGAPFDSDDLITFHALSSQIGKSYENIVYYNEYLEKQNIEKELEVTKKIQQHVLPKEFPNIDGLDISAYNIPAKEVGGDFYDYINIEPDVHAFLIADVSGKSLPASMFMAFARSITRVESRNLVSPSRVLEESNKYIFKDSQSGMFVTMFYLALYTRQKLIKFGSAGHNEQLLYNNEKDKFELLNVKGIPLGISDNSIYMEASINYKPGDILVLYTDGVTEAMNKIGEEFELERLKEIVRKNKDLPAYKIKENIIKSVNEFAKDMPQFDDITLLVLKFV